MEGISLDYKAKQKLPELISVKTVGAILNVSRTVVMRLVHTGALSSALIGSCWIIGKRSLDDYLAYKNRGDVNSDEASPEK